MSKQKILIVEDDITLRIGIEAAMKREGFLPLGASSAQEVSALLTERPDLVLLDLNLPDKDGFFLCRYIKEKSGIPVIFLTVRDDESDIVKGLDMGGDDYITKPFRLPVLLSRVKAVLRRAESTEQKDELRVGRIRLIRSRTQVFVGEQKVMLTVGEYRLLELLMQHKNMTMTRASLLERLWDDDENYVNDNTLTVMMKRLREKVEENPTAPKIIMTVRGIGYKAADEEENRE
jgi:DNA-binding response OmpR family regulator